MDTNQAELMAKELINQHCPEYQFKWNNRKSSFGTCNWSKKIIALSKYLTTMNNEEEVHDCILHEIAHALTPHKGHSHEWKKAAKEIGCRGERCFNAIKVATPKGIGEFRCDNCNLTVGIYRRHRKYDCYRCSKCKNKLIATIY